MAVAEYCLLVSTFACVLAFGLEGGIGAGAVLSALHFAYSYSRVSLHAFTVVPSRSGAVRPFDQVGWGWAGMCGWLGESSRV